MKYCFSYMILAKCLTIITTRLVARQCRWQGNIGGKVNVYVGDKGYMYDDHMIYMIINWLIEMISGFHSDK